MRRPVRGAVAPSVCGPPRVRRGPLPGSWGLRPDPGGILPQSQWHSPGAGPGPRAQAVRLPAQGMRTVEPFLREGRSEGVCRICVLGWPPSPAAAWGLHGEAAWRLLGASDRTGKGSAQDSQDELRGGVRRVRRGPPRKAPSLEHPVPPTRLGDSCPGPPHPPATMAWPGRGDRSPETRCSVQAAPSQLQAVSLPGR